MLQIWEHEQHQTNVFTQTAGQIDSWTQLQVELNKATILEDGEKLELWVIIPRIVPFLLFFKGSTKHKQKKGKQTCFIFLYTWTITSFSQSMRNCSQIEESSFLLFFLDYFLFTFIYSLIFYTLLCMLHCIQKLIFIQLLHCRFLFITVSVLKARGGGGTHIWNRQGCSSSQLRM